MKRIIEIAALENGGHRNQTIDNEKMPKGWAVVPDEMETPNFPFGEIVVEEIDGVPTVIKWIPIDIPEPEPIEIKPTAQDDIDAMLVDHEYRLTLLELGVTE